MIGTCEYNDQQTDMIDCLVYIHTDRHTGRLDCLVYRQTGRLGCLVYRQVDWQQTDTDRIICAHVHASMCVYTRTPAHTHTHTYTHTHTHRSEVFCFASPSQTTNCQLYQTNYLSGGNQKSSLLSIAFPHYRVVCRTVYI